MTLGYYWIFALIARVNNTIMLHIFMRLSIESLIFFNSSVIIYLFLINTTYSYHYYYYYFLTMISRSESK